MQLYITLMPIKEVSMVAAIQDRITEVRDFLQVRLTDIHEIQAHPDNLPVMQAVLY